MSGEIIKTIEDMEKIYYSAAGQSFLNSDDMMSPMLMKNDAPVITTTTGVYNAVYGAQAWVQLNMEANTVGFLPKNPWARSGWRVITARSNTEPYGGVAETASLPDTTKPTFAEVSTKPKLSAVTFETGEIQEYLATQGGDDAFAAMSDMRTYMAVEHKEDLNKQLNTEGGTLASYNFESMDRVCSNYAELSNKSSDQSTAIGAGDLDIYSLDKDGGATFADAYVSQTATSGTMRSLTDGLLNSLLQNTLSNGANPDGQIIQTGYDAWSSINQLYDPQVRYNLIGAAQVQPGVNGIKTLKGTGVGLTVATLFNKPIILSKNTVAETGGISRIYMVDISNPEGFDLPRLGMKVAKPTQYFEAGMNQGTPFPVDKFSTKGMYRTMGELICTFFKAQGKIRDLNA